MLSDTLRPMGFLDEREAVQAAAAARTAERMARAAARKAGAA